MVDERAYLYDSTLQPLGPVGLFVKLLGGGGYGSYPGEFDAAVFSPWPDVLDEGVPFAIRTELASGATQWRSPHEVANFRAVGQPSSTNVAIVVLEGPSTATSAVSGGGGLAHASGIDTHGIRTELANFSPTFKPLLKETDSRRRLAALGEPPVDKRAVRRKMATPGYTRTTGTARVVNRGLCRILRWD